MPLFPFHTWLPDAHVQAPTAGSVILAGVLLKMGTYGLLRFAFPLFPDAALDFAPLLATLAVIAIVYGALVAMVQPDMKKLVAYSSVSHMGFVVLGIAAMNVQGVQGASYQMLAHGVSTGGLFCDGRHAVGPAAHAAHQRVRRSQGRDAAADRGLPHHHAVVDRPARPERLRRRVPDPAGRVPLGADASWSSPGLGVILSAVYMLWMFQRVYYGAVTHEENRHLTDLSPREWAVIGPLCAMSILMGVAPNVFLTPMEPAVTRIVQRLEAREPMRVDAGWRSWFAGPPAPVTARRAGEGQ